MHTVDFQYSDIAGDYRRPTLPRNRTIEQVLLELSPAESLDIALLIRS